jgi:hypothetical protein
MISFSKILRGIRAILGLVEEVEEVIPLTQPSRQLSPEDVRRQQAQIQSAVSFKVPPKR